ncbi:MAG: hypothetical protein AAF383_07620 [Cyanobacteria bacterium P01_A01_bin.83]
MDNGTNVRQEISSHLHQLSAEQIKQAVISWIDTDNAEIEDLEKILSSQIAKKETTNKTSIQERLAAFDDWVESHRGQNLPSLSDEAISRESIYEDRFSTLCAG